MDPVVAQRKLLETLGELVARKNVFEGYGWQLVPPVLHIWMSPRGQPDRRYLLRISFDGFPDEAPSYLPANHQTREPDSSAWPAMSAFKADWPGFCLNGTREFYHRGHPDRKSQWSPERFPVVSVLQEIQVELNKCK